MEGLLCPVIAEVIYYRNSLLYKFTTEKRPIIVSGGSA